MQQQLAAEGNAMREGLAQERARLAERCGHIARHMIGIRPGRGIETPVGCLTDCCDVDDPSLLTPVVCDVDLGGCRWAALESERQRSEEEFQRKQETIDTQVHASNTCVPSLTCSIRASPYDFRLLSSDLFSSAVGRRKPSWSRSVWSWRVCSGRPRGRPRSSVVGTRTRRPSYSAPRTSSSERPPTTSSRCASDNETERGGEGRVETAASKPHVGMFGRPVLTHAPPLLLPGVPLAPRDRACRGAAARGTGGRGEARGGEAAAGAPGRRPAARLGGAHLQARRSREYRMSPHAYARGLPRFVGVLPSSSSTHPVQTPLDSAVSNHRRRSCVAPRRCTPRRWP